MVEGSALAGPCAKDWPFLNHGWCTMTNHLLAALRQFSLERFQFNLLRGQIESAFPGVPYGRLRVGLTDDLGRRMQEHARRYGVGVGSLRGWYWPTPTKAVARALESFFVELGMVGSPGGTGWKIIYVIFTPLRSPLLQALAAPPAQVCQEWLWRPGSPVGPLASSRRRDERCAPWPQRAGTSPNAVSRLLSLLAPPGRSEPGSDPR